MKLSYFCYLDSTRGSLLVGFLQYNFKFHVTFVGALFVVLSDAPNMKMLGLLQVIARSNLYFYVSVLYSLSSQISIQKAFSFVIFWSMSNRGRVLITL